MGQAKKNTSERALARADYHRIHFEDSRDVLFVLDRQLAIQAASPSLERVLGHRPEDAEKRRTRLDRFLLPGQGQGIRRLVRAALAGRETWPAICEARTRDGSTRTLEFVAGRPMGKGAGRLLAVSARDITEWQRLADAVRQSEMKYRGLIEATDTGFVILDGRGRVLDANREYLRLTGRKQLSAIQGKHVAEWTSPHDLERNRAEVARCLRRGSVRLLEIDYKQPDGSLVPVEINATVVESDTGPQIVSIVRDISRRRDVETALRDSERQYRLLVQNQGEGIGIVDQAERFVFANPAAEEIFGVKPGGLIGRTLRDFTTPEQYAEAVRQTGLRRQGLKSTYEMGIRRRDGQERQLLVTATPQQDRQGRFSGTFGIFRDITVREKAEEALRASEHLYRTVVETSNDAITVSDLSGKVVAANQKAADMQGVPGPSHLIGLDVFGFIAPEDRARAAENARKVLAGNPVERVEYRLLRGDGSSFDCELSASLLPGADGRPAGFVAAVRDVTERKRAEQALRESEERLRFLGDNMPGIFFYQVDTGADGRSRRFTYLSDGVAKLHETTVKEALEDPDQVYGKICQEHRGLLAEKEAAAIAAMNPFHAEVRLDLPSGGTRWMQYISIPQREPGRHLWDGIGIDVTERKQAEQALRESEERYRLLAENSNEVVWTADLQNRFTFVSPSIQRLQGFTAQEAMAMGMEGLVAPGSLERLRSIHREGARVLARDPRGDILAKAADLECLHKSGGTIWCEVTAMVLLDGSGRPSSLLGVTRDISERKRAEEALRESEEKYRTLIDQASDGIMLMPVGGTGYTVNQAFARMHGYQSPEEMAKLGLEDLDTPESASLIRERLDRMLAGEHLRFEVEHFHRDGHVFPLQVSCSVVRIGDTAYFLGFHRDITERKRLEKEVLEIGDRVQYHIGHDLHDGVNQLLTVASLRVGALQQKMKEGRLPGEGELAELSDLVRQTMDQVSSLARGLSPLSLKTGGLPLGLTELSKTTAQLGVECRVSLDESVKVNDLAAATHLYRIAQEAVNNSLKHSGATLIEISLRREKRNAVLAVSDNGRGMAEQPKSKGMGMSIMKYRAGMIGAELEVSPGRSGGTVVRCTFPEAGGAGKTMRRKG